jgi:predicted permease
MISRFWRRARWDDERSRELEAHLAIETDENIARGMEPHEARLAAHRKVGNVTRIREDIYQFNTIGLVENTWRDLRHGARLLRRSPGFALVAIVSLALGVGANTAIFQLVDAVRLRPLPVHGADDLAEVRIPSDRGPSGAFTGNHPMLTNALWEQLRDRQQAFSGIFAWGSPEFELSAGGESRPAEGLWVSGDFFSTLEVRPAIGRMLATADDRRGCAAPAAVISHGFWQREYGGSPSAIGRAITLDGHPFEIVGVTSAGFFGVEVGRGFDIAVPLCAEALLRGPASSLNRKDAWFLGAIGRLKPGWSIERANAHLAAIAPAMFRDTLPNYRADEAEQYLAFSLAAYPARTGVSTLRSAYESPLWLLLATTALVLLVACANLANLMLARATAREREIAVRLALGASRGRLIRQLLAESVLIAAAGAAAGAVLAQSVSRALVGALTTDDQRIVVTLTGDWRIFLFVALIGGCACALFGLIPAVRATATTPAVAIKAGGRGATDSRERFGLRRALVVLQVAMSLVLVVSALLFARSLQNILTIDPGFSPDAILVSTIDFRRAAIPDGAMKPAHHAVLERVRRLPGVEAAAQVRIVPVSGSFSNRNIIIDAVSRSENVNRNIVSGGYFQTMHIPLLAGRDFDDRDGAADAKVAIVTESFARTFFNGQNPVGRTFQIAEAPGTARPPYQIVGLVRDTKFEDLRETVAPMMYLPAAQDDQTASAVQRLVIRHRGPLSSIVGGVAALARETHPSIIVTFRTLDGQMRDSLLRERLMATLSGLFGVLAMVIAMIGVYGVMSYTVARRRNEIGVRIALGADRGDVLRMVMREACALLAVGLAIGTPLALAAARGAAALLYGLTPNDPTTVVAAVATLGSVAVLASYLPARRASRLEPTVALREE